MRLWDAATGSRESQTHRAYGLTRMSVSVAFSPDGQTLASGSLDNTVRLWDVATRKEKAKLTIGIRQHVQQRSI